MAIRIKHKVNVRCAEDTDMKNLLFAPDDELSEVTIDAYVRQTSGKIAVSMNTNEDLPLGDVTAVKGIYLIVDKEAVITLNGGAETIQMRKPTTSATVYARLFLEADITQVNIAAPDTEDLVGTFCVWGDTA